MGDLHDAETRASPRHVGTAVIPVIRSARPGYSGNRSSRRQTAPPIAADLARRYRYPIE